jgi:hypothetical protein
MNPKNRASSFGTRETLIYTADISSEKPLRRSNLCGENLKLCHGQQAALRVFQCGLDLRTLAWPRFESRLRELHPYDVPEIVALKSEQVAESYARWVAQSVA